MSTYFYKTFVKNNLNPNLTQSMINRMITRQHVDRVDRLHPAAKKRLIETTQPPLPLKYPLQTVPDDHDFWNEPLGNTQDIPFHVQRTYRRNLPVYTVIKMNGMLKVTSIKKLTGDIDVSL